MAKNRIIDKFLTLYQNIWLLIFGIIFIPFIIFTFILNPKLLIVAIAIIVVIAIYLAIFILIGRKQIKATDKKITNYEKVSKKDYDFWKKNYKGNLAYGDYENYLRICSLPPEERAPALKDIFEGADFSKVFEDIKRKKEKK